MSVHGGSRLRVVQVVERLERGGLEQVVESLACGLQARGHDVRVLTLCGGGAVADRIARAGIAIERAASPPLLRPGAVRALARHFSSMKAQVVHGHGYLAGTLSRLAGLLAGAPCRIIHRHTLDENEGARHRLLERALRGGAWALCCSEAVRARAVALGADPLRIDVVYNGVSFDRFSGARVPRAGAARILCVASLRALKGHRVLLDAAALLAGRGLDFEIRLAGEGSERGALEERAAALGLGARVRFLGERDDIPDLLAGSDLFVLASTSREGLSLATLEAMASGLPVVAARTGGLEEIVRDGSTGILVPPGEPGPLAGAIERLLAEPDRARSMGRQGRERVQRFFGSERMLDRVEEVYGRACHEVRDARTVLYLSARGSDFGGGQAGLKMLAASAGERSYKPVVVVPEPGRLAADLSASGVRTVLLPLPPLRSLAAHRVAAAILRLRRLARMIRAGVVHVDDTRGALYALALPRRIRRVWHLRDVRPDPLDRFLGARFDRLIAVSGAVARRRFPRLDPPRLAVIANGVPEPRALRSREEIRREMGAAPGDLLLLAVGRVEPQKGIQELVGALARIAGKLPGVRVVVAGQVSGEERLRLEAAASELGIASCFHLLGARDDVADLMSAADLLVHSSWYEAAPRAVLEAMAANLPVIATDVGGIPEILEGCGELVREKDPDALARAIAAMASDPERRRSNAARARDRYESLYTPGRHLQAVHALYQELTREGAGTEAP